MRIYLGALILLIIAFIIPGKNKRLSTFGEILGGASIGLLYANTILMFL